MGHMLISTPYMHMIMIAGLLLIMLPACLPREELNPRTRNPVVDGYWNACAYLNLIIPSP